MSAWDADRCAIHIASDVSTIEALVAAAARDGAHRTDLDLSLPADRSELLEQLRTRFSIPYPMGGLDGALDWLSDLEWLSAPNGHIVIVYGVDDARPEVRDAFVALLPFVLDRWREASPLPYVIALRARSHRADVMSTLSAGNSELARIGQQDTLTHTAPVPVIIDGELVDPSN